MLAGMSEANIPHLAKLCRIQCSEEELKKLEDNFQKILGYMELLDEVNTQDVPPCTHVLETIQNVMEEDEIKAGFDRNDFLKNAPDQVGGMIKVPPVMQD